MALIDADAHRTPPPPPPGGAGPGARHAVLLVVGVLLAGLGLVLTGAAAALGVAVFQRSSGGYVSTTTERYAVATYAITSEQLDVVLDQSMPSDRFRWPAPGVMLRATSAIPGEDVFVGVGPQAEVARYLSDVEHSELTEIRFSPFQPAYRTSAGSQSPAPPGAQDFWTVSSQGAGTQQIEAELRTGDWAVVVMNADGSRPVAVDLQAGVRASDVSPVTRGALAAGIVVLVAGLALVVAGAMGLGSGRPPGPGAPPPGQGTLPNPYEAPANPYESPAHLQEAPLSPQAPAVAAGAPYPARLTGQLDPGLSRWLWLVKWVLAFPHYVVLVFLWCAFVVTTVVAGVAILATGRYPRRLFDFNVGVLRWSWRVGFYAYAALGTDRYPPFTLARTDYPAGFDVDYPEHLSRGLVLVKSWLLAVPHLLIVGFFSANLSFWWGTRDSWAADYSSTAGISLLGLLVVIAGFFLLVTREYPRALFDLVLGLDRWQYRVITYVALMRDEYPPFHLDQGGQDVGPLDPPTPVEPDPVRIVG